MYRLMIQNVEVVCETAADVYSLVSYRGAVRREEREREESNRDTILTAALTHAAKRGANVTPLQRAIGVLGALYKNESMTPTEMAKIHGSKPVAITGVLRPLRSLCQKHNLDFDDYMVRKADGRGSSTWYATNRTPELLTLALESAGG